MFDLVDVVGQLDRFRVQSFEVAFEFLRDRLLVDRGGLFQSLQNLVGLVDYGANPCLTLFEVGDVEIEEDHLDVVLRQTGRGTLMGLAAQHVEGGLLLLEDCLRQLQHRPVDGVLLLVSAQSTVPTGSPRSSRL